MNRFSQVVFVLSLLLFVPAFAICQEDLGRESGLPSRIGGNRCEGIRPGANATLQGTFNVTGMQNSEKPPTFSVALYAGGAFISRQRIKNGGTFYFYCVPGQSVFISAEVNSTEVQTYPVGSLDPPPQTNYQDVYLTWSAASDAIRKRNEVVSVRNSYDRSKANQKRFDKAMAKLAENDIKTAGNVLEELVADDPNDYVAITELANIKCDAGQFADAKPLYEKAVTLKADFINALFGLGRTELALKDVSHAIEVLTQAYKIKPDSADVNHYLGEAYLQNKQGTLAITHMRKAIELAPMEKTDLYLRIAWLYNAAGARDLAAEEYKKFLKLKPNHPDKEKMLQYIAENSH